MMDRSSLLLLGCLATCQVAAQAYIGNRCGVGFYRQLAKMDGEVRDPFEEDMESLTAPTITLPVEVRLSEHVAVIAEPGFVQRGSRHEGTLTGTNSNVSYSTSQRVNCVELALLVKGSMDLGRFTPYVIAGPSITRPISVRVASDYHEDLSGLEGHSEATTSTDDLSVFESTSFNACAGVGVAWSLGAPYLFLDYRRLWGLSPVQSLQVVDINLNELGPVDFFDRGHIISFGVMIPLSRDAWGGSPPSESTPAAP